MCGGARGVTLPLPEEGKTVRMGGESGAGFVHVILNGVKEWDGIEGLMRYDRMASTF